MEERKVNKVDMRDDELVTRFLTNMRRSKMKGTHQMAKNSVSLLRDIITQRRWSTAKELMELVRSTGRAINSNNPTEAVVGNMVRRVLRLIREGYAECLKEDKQSHLVSALSLHEMLTADGREEDDYNTVCKDLKKAVVRDINDLLDELDDSAHNIAQQALEHIHSSEVVMTIGRSRTVEAFLKSAAKVRSFHVIIAECAPAYEAQDLAISLGKEGIDTTLITDSAIFAVMSRVNKVIIGTSAVMADGGLMTVNGCQALAMAAKHHSVPILVCASMSKLCPRYVCSYDQDMFNSLSSPNDVLDYSEGDLVGSVQCVQPMFDYVPSDMINLFISNFGGNAPSYVYRLLSEYYHEEDFEL